MKYPHAKPTVATSAHNRQQWLVELVNENNWTHGAEIGACKGKTLFYLLDHCAGLHMIGVDLWAEQPGKLEDYTQTNWKHDWASKMVKDKAKGYDRARIIHDYSTTAALAVADESLDFVFIDADHTAVAADIEAWKPKLRPGGKFTGHDINWPTVRVDVDLLIKEYEVGPDNCWLEK